MPPDKKGLELFGRALADPFCEHVADWFEYLMEELPLWSFQRQAFQDEEESSLPLLGPLRPFVESILRDEGVLAGTVDLSPLVTTLDFRRVSLLLGAPRENMATYSVRPGRLPELLDNLNRWTHQFILCINTLCNNG